MYICLTFSTFHDEENDASNEHEYEYCTAHVHCNCNDGNVVLRSTAAGNGTVKFSKYNNYTFRTCILHTYYII